MLQRLSSHSAALRRGFAGHSVSRADAALRRSLVRPEREQHGTVLLEAASDAPGVMVARAAPMVELLERRGTLSRRQARAGAFVYECWAIGIAGARDAEAGGSTVHDPGGIRDRQLDAATAYRRMRDAVGPRLWPITFAVTVEEWSCARWANERGRGMHKLGAVALLQTALDTIADHLGLAER